MNMPSEQPIDEPYIWKQIIWEGIVLYDPIWRKRASLTIGIASAVIGTLIAVYGTLSGWHKHVDRLMMKATDLFMSTQHYCL